MSTMQLFYTRLSAQPRHSYFGALVALTKARLNQVKALAREWWSW